MTLAFQRTQLDGTINRRARFEEQPNQVITGLLYQNGSAFPVRMAFQKLG